MKRCKGFVSIEVMLVSLVCSMIVTILMDNSFQRRKELDRSFKIVGANIDKNNQEEQFLKYMLKENILNKDNFQDLEFSLNNMKAEYSKKESILNIKNKDKTSGLFKESYYEIKVINDDIILSKRGNYEFVNKNLKD
ncbi:type IV pilin [Clostridium perfringens]|uniref:Type IV pilin n=1 Tax=Clostridium perfringens TaxID=1502 RepID=A0AAP4EE91_CLOPF|nr:type IV pilin [Clostridium perfringens]MCX0369189.1 type IV pilin [Clostridium perfringens]MDH2335253.1 type IV pilin [Clostridium perfringens]MDK0685822.1 type IV pilin [Clostridium perfringens]MDM0494128.1 type IV pilin [Clostridium perfringens]MDU2663765.1 type IV pilin [Clostridium perfringens]